jgi:hypothetical protein
MKDAMSGVGSAPRWRESSVEEDFVVTSLTQAECKPKFLYEKLYCARGEMENRIKESQLDLYADRTSTATMRTNQLRQWLASFRLHPTLRCTPDCIASHAVCQCDLRHEPA